MSRRKREAAKPVSERDADPDAKTEETAVSGAAGADGDGSASEPSSGAETGSAGDDGGSPPPLPAPNTSETVVRDVDPAAKPKAAPVPKSLKDLAPKVEDEGDGGRRLPAYNLRNKAHSDVMSRGLDAGDTSKIPKPGKWRVMRQQNVALRGNVTLLREGAVVGTDSHDIPFLKRCGVSLRPVNQEARDYDAKGGD